jgi:aminoglycoside phosphotransferase (APT) family kinase protein
MIPEEIIAKRPHKTVFRDGDLAVKVFDESFSKADILHEALNNACVEETGLPVPRLIEVGRTGGKWAITTEYIGGNTIGAMVKNFPDRADEYLEKFVDLQLEIHKKTSSKLTRQRDKFQKAISNSSLPYEVRYELHTLLDSLPLHEKLCHGDYVPSNVIVRFDGTLAVLDWAHATVGNASADAGNTYMRFCLDGQQEIGEKYLALFCQKTKIQRQYVNQWLPIVAAVQLSKGNPEEKELLQSWAVVSDYQ